MLSCTSTAGESKEGESTLRRLVACGGMPAMTTTSGGSVASKLFATPTTSTPAASSKRLSLVSTLLGNCGIICTAFPDEVKDHSMVMSTQFVELHGLRFIGLGAVVDELTPRERVYDTLEQLTTRTERMISIGCLIDIPAIMAENRFLQTGPIKITETAPLDVWNTRYPNSTSMAVAHIVDDAKNKRYKSLTDTFTRALATQMAHPNRGSNRYLAGITAHNLGVVNVLAGREEEAMTYFREAIRLKTLAFGKDNPEVALSCDELGIQLFAKGDFDAALACFKEALAIRNRLQDASRQPQQAMVLNNMACCYFELGDHRKALSLLQEADDIQHLAIGSSAQADLDLLHVAIVICNCGYLMLALKNYEDARSLLEEALLIQQSVLDEGHRAIRDTMSNLEFSNAFHL